MYPLVYHLGIDEYFPSEEFEPHLFQHRAAARRLARRPSVIRRVGTALMHAIRPDRSASGAAGTRQRPTRPSEPAIRWG